MVISVNNLSMYYKIHKKNPGLTGALRAFFVRQYEIIKAVEDISFTIDEGEIVGFIGPNGEGKTTTLKCLSGLLYSTKGKVSVLGFTPFDRKTEFLKQISLVVGQKNQLWWDLPAMDTFVLNKEIYDIPQQQFNEVVYDLAQCLDVIDLLHIPVRKLSLGQRMRMELIASLIHSPKVLFLDEPTIGLDVVMQKTIREFLQEYNKKYKATILLTSHYMKDVEELCKRVIVINKGKILYDGLLSEIVRKSAPYKLVKVVFSKYVDPKKLESFGETKHFSYPLWEIKIRRDDVSTFAAKVLEDFPVEDINIEDPEITDVIASFFEESQGK